MDRMKQLITSYELECPSSKYDYGLMMTMNLIAIRNFNRANDNDIGNNN